MTDGFPNSNPPAEEDACRVALLKAAELVAEAKCYPAPLPDGFASSIEPACVAGHIEISNCEISFTSDELLAEWVARWCAASIAAQWADISLATQALSETERLRIRLGLPNSFSVALLASLEGDHGISVLARLEEVSRIDVGAGGTNGALDEIYFTFCAALPALDYEPSELAERLIPVLDANSRNMSRDRLYSLYSAIEQLAGRSRDYAEALIDAFLGHPAQQSTELAANALLALWRIAPIRAHKRALELSKSQMVPVWRVGAFALASFEYDLPRDSECFKDAIERLEQMCEGLDLQAEFVQAIGNLIVCPGNCEFLPLLTRRFIQFASNESTEVQHCVAVCLRERSDEAQDSEWFWNSLDCLSDITDLQASTLNQLDWAVSSTVECHPDRVTRFLQRVVERCAHGSGSDGKSLSSLYKHTIASLLEQQPALESTITRWFASRNRYLHAEAAQLVREFVLNPYRDADRTLRLDKSVLDGLEDSDVLRLLCALEGHVDDYRILAGLLISVLDKESVNEPIIGQIRKALEEVVLYNSPHFAKAYLKGHHMEPTVSAHAHAVVAEALSLSEEYYHIRKGRPTLKELMPPDSRVDRYRVAFQKSLYQAHQLNASDRTGFLNYIPTIPVKFGRASFSAGNDSMGNPAPMLTFRTESEYPRGNIIDPLGFTMQKRLWRYMAVQGVPSKQGNSADYPRCKSNEEDCK